MTDVDYFSKNKIKIHYKGNEIINKIQKLLKVLKLHMRVIHILDMSQMFQLNQ